MGELSKKFSQYDEQTGEYIETTFNHLDLPEDLKNPVLDGVERTMNLGITRAPGWHYADNSMLFIPAYRKVVGQSLSFRISFADKEGKPHKDGLLFEFSKSRSFNSKIAIADIFNVVFNISDADQIRSLIGTHSDLLTHTYIKKKTGKKLLDAIKYKDLPSAVDLTIKLKSMITTQTKLESPDRLYDILSLRHFVGCSLANETTVGNITYPKFTVLDKVLAFDIEHSDLDSITLLTQDAQRVDVSIVNQLYCELKKGEIPVDMQAEFSKLETQKNDFSFNGKAYSKEGAPKQNTLVIYCAIINRLFAFNTAKINFSMQDYRNQKIVTFEDNIEDFIRTDLEDVHNKIDATGSLLQGVSGHYFDVGRANKIIKNSESALAVITKNENPLARTSQGKVLVRNVEFLPKDAVSVLPQDLGLIDPVDTAESKNIGKSTPVTMTTEIGEDGDLYTPLYKVVDGEVTREVDMIPVADLPNLFVAEEGAVLKGNVLAKHQGVVKLFPSHVVTHVRVSPFSSTSVCRGSSAFMENTDQKRTQMTANAQKQARTILRPSRALLETGVEAIAANGGAGIKNKFSVEDLFADKGIQPEELQGHKFEIVEIKNTGMSKEFRLTSLSNLELFVTFSVVTEKSPSGSSYFYELVAPSDLTEFYSPKDVVYKQHNIVLSGKVEGSDRLDYHTNGKEDYFETTTANGKDLFVMFGFSEAYTVDDASVISDRLVRDMSLATPVLVTKHFKKDRLFSKNMEEKFGFPKGNIPEGYSDDGLPVVGTYLRPGTHWIYKYEENTFDGTIVEKNLRLSSFEHGEVIAVENGKEEIKVTLAKWVQVEVGDKFSARHGNKTIIARVMPAEMMPFHPQTGRHIDMIINPLGIPSRGNISQLAEIQKTAEIREQGLDSKVIPPFSNELMKMVENYEEGKELTELQLINPQTGLYYPKKHFCGYMHYLRNAKIAEKQLHAVGDSTEMDTAFGQPVGTSELHEKGQSISSMEKEILVSYGATGIVDEIHSVLSADQEGFIKVEEAFKEDPLLPSVHYEGKNLHAEHMQHAALSFHIHIKQIGGNISLDYLTDKDMDNFEEINPKNADYMLTDYKYLNTMMYIPLPRKFITPVALKKFSFTNIITVNTINKNGVKNSRVTLGSNAVERIINNSNMFVVRDMGEDEIPQVTVFPRDLEPEFLEKHNIKDILPQTGMLDFIEFLEKYPIELWIENLKARTPDAFNKNNEFVDDSDKILERAEQNAKTGGFNKFITTRFPVLPNKYRQGKNEINKKDSFTAGYKDIILRAQDYGLNPDSGKHLYNRMAKMMLPSDDSSQRLSLYELWAKKDTGGRIRSKILKTRVLCSMRSTIVPMFSGDPKKYGYPSFAGHPDSIGLPLVGALRIAQPRLIAYLNKHHKDIIDGLTEIDAVSKVIDILTLPFDSVEEVTGWSTETIATRVRDLKKELIDFVNGSLVFYGRAPSLHETSLRGGRVYVHEQSVIHLHSLLTTDLNADHDGDQIYVVMPVTDEAVKDIEEKLLPSNNALRYNDGKPSLAISQDALLGIYFATEDPTSELVRPMSSVEQVRYFLDLRKINLNDLVVININNEIQVKATVGRVIIHDIIYGYDDLALPQLVKQEDGFYAPKYNSVINGSALSALQLAIAKEFSTSSKFVTNIYSNLQQFGYQAVEMRNLTVGIKDLTPVLKVDSINKEVKKHVETARTLEELGLLPEDYLDALDKNTRELIKGLKIMDLVPDDNAFKILALSGAKGNEASIEKMFGVQGFVGGAHGQNLATPILSNIVRGISQFQVEDLSYTQRENAISTVFETSKPGETLRTGAFALSGLIIQPNGKEDEAEQLVYYNKRRYAKEVLLGEKKSEAVAITSAPEYNYKGKPLTEDLVRELAYNTTSKLELDEKDKFLFFSSARVDRVWVGKDRKTAVEGDYFPEYHYKGQELDSNIIRQLVGSSMPQVPLDEEGMYVFLDVELHPFAKAYFNNKMDLTGKKVSERQLEKMLESYPSYVPLATHANEFSVEYGISQKHAGFRSGSTKPYSLGQNVGIKSSTATAQPANQLVISKRNMDRSAGLDNGIDLFKAAIQNASYYKDDYKSYELLAPADGIIYKVENSVGTHIRLEALDGTVYEHLVKAEDEKYFKFPFKTEDYVFLGQTILTPDKLTDGDRLVHPLNSFLWDRTIIEHTDEYGVPRPLAFKKHLINPSRDLVQLIRFYIMAYLESIYRVNNINLDPNHYGSFALQQTRFCRVLLPDAKAGNEVQKGYLNLANYFNETVVKYPETIVDFKITSASDTILLTAGPISALCYRNAISVSEKAARLGPIREFGSLSKVALGLSLDKDFSEKQVVVDNPSGKSTIRYVQQDKGDSISFQFETDDEIVSEEEIENDLFSTFFGDDMDDDTNESNDESGEESTKDSKDDPFDAFFGNDFETSKTQIAEQKRSTIFGGGNE